MTLRPLPFPIKVEDNSLIGGGFSAEPERRPNVYTIKQVGQFYNVLNRDGSIHIERITYQMACEFDRGATCKWITK
jgi:hypothetical protein